MVALDIETETRWPGTGPKVDYGLSYAAAVTVIGLAWREGDHLVTTAVAAPFDDAIRAFLTQLFSGQTLIVAHNAVFDLRQLSKLTGGLTPERIWDTQSMARLLHPAIAVSYILLGVATMLGLPFP